jgi:hypothetical protein
LEHCAGNLLSGAALALGVGLTSWFTLPTAMVVAMASRAAWLMAIWIIVSPMVISLRRPAP